ncbi:hypothetical protein M404DRAFT_712613 [Pisolithus tinctorius Marx 270]|uniref:Uncharacterized protein n=1 Tax=Pisolithus tinctorius Marx 270 TaxID=870435 RepID=A0A0C3P490_PISTI|nr:hypothetical protein M404DRAFT_712613 [Pisolithus tinctorius Marx 270]
MSGRVVTNSHSMSGVDGSDLHGPPGDSLGEEGRGGVDDWLAEAVRAVGRLTPNSRGASRVSHLSVLTDLHKRRDLLRDHFRFDACSHRRSSYV